MATAMLTGKMGHSKREAGDSLGVCEKTIDNMIRRGELRAVKVGRRTIILDADLQEFLATRPVVAAEAN